MLLAGQTKADVESVPTDVVLQVFADRIVVLVTQLGKVGTLVRPRKPYRATSLSQCSCRYKLAFLPTHHSTIWSETLPTSKMHPQANCPIHHSLRRLHLYR